MKEWSELEERYQQMMNTDPAAAQTFRQRMTAKFQANVQVSNILPFKQIVIVYYKLHFLIVQKSNLKIYQKF